MQLYKANPIGHLSGKYLFLCEPLRSPVRRMSSFEYPAYLSPPIGLRLCGEI